MALWLSTGSLCHGLYSDKGVQVHVHVAGQQGAVLSPVSQKRSSAQRRGSMSLNCEGAACARRLHDLEGTNGLVTAKFECVGAHGVTMWELRMKRPKCRLSCANSASLRTDAFDRGSGRPVKLKFRGTSSIRDGSSIPRSLSFEECFSELVGFVQVSDKGWGICERRLGPGEVVNVLFQQLKNGFQRHIRASINNSTNALPWHGHKANRMPLSNRGHICKASKRGSNSSQPIPPEEESDPKRRSSEGTGGDASRSFPRPPMVPETDWRLVRARFVAGEQTYSINSTGSDAADAKAAPDSLPGAGSHAFYPAVGKRWAHHILAPEAGAVLIASEKLDGMPNFERSVVLLLNGGLGLSKNGPYGLILNQPLPRRIKHVRPKDQALVKTFGSCQVHVGGPLDTNKFMLLHATPGVKNFREVVPGVYYGSADGLEPAAEMARVKNALPQDLRFFFGYVGWATDQLKKEIALGLWHVAACSTDLATGVSNAGLWEEILLLMGGKYAELSKRPRRKL